MELQAPRPLINENGEITSFVQRQVPMTVQYGTNHNAFYNPNMMPGMNGPFKFFVHTPAHFLPDPATPVAQPGFQSMGCQAAMSPVFTSMVGSPVAPGGTPVGPSGTPVSTVPANAFGVPAASPVNAGLQVPTTFAPQVSGSAFTDVSSRMTVGPQGFTSGSPVVYQSGGPDSQLMMSGVPVQMIPGPPPASLGGSTPLTPVPAAFQSGHSSSLGTPQPMVPVVPHATSDHMAAAAAKVPIPRPHEDGTSTSMTTGTKFSTPKAAKKPKKKEKSNRCMCF